MHKEYLINWKDYACGANGQIWSNHYKRYLNGRITEDGYIVVKLRCIDGKCRMFLWHRVIWTFFYGTIPEDKEINHISEVKTDNRLCNLECVSHLQNMRHGTCVERAIEKRKKPVVAVDSDGNVVYEFASIKEAILYGFVPNNISDCCNGKRKTHKGLRWYFKEEWLKIIENK